MNAYHIRFEVCACIVGADHFLLNRRITHIVHFSYANVNLPKEEKFMQVKYDRKLLIAVGRSRKSAQWQNRELTWSELLDKLSQTTRTRETAAELAGRAT